ncbi:MAG: DUF4158 domain-containing protein [Gammaproteobacteria bacterium]|nr:DUF4158 domain-containing protein [Gammaproteobacteria bacterium]
MRDKRLKILSKSEINELYDLPTFSHQEQQSYFHLNEKEFQLMDSRGSLTSKVYFILQLGYFKATSQFFDFRLSDVKSDMQFVLQHHFNGKKLSSDSISKDTRLSHKTLIAQLLSFETDKLIVKTKMEKLLETKSRLSNNPVYLFHELLCYCSEHKLLLLGYTTIQELIGQAIQCEEMRLEELLLKHLSHQDWRLIDQLLKNNNQDVFSALKRDPKSFQKKHIKAEIKKIVDYETLYHVAQKVLPKLDITPQNISYYSSLAEHYPIRDLGRLSATKQAIYILCYVHHRHQKVNDNLTISFAYYVDKFGADALDNAQKTIFDEKCEVNDDTQNAALVFRFFDDEKISDKESFGSIRTRARKYVKKGNFNKVADYLMGLLFDFRQTKWDEIAKLKHKITANLRPIFKVLEFSGDDNQKHLLSAITFLKKYFFCQDKERKNLVKNIPIQFIPHPLRNFIISDDEIIDIAKYEFMLYQQIVEQIETGHIYLQNSLSFKSFSSYLISDEKWKNKLEILKELGNKKLLMPIDQLLNDFENSLESLILGVNERIKSGDNKDIKIKKKKIKEKINKKKMISRSPFPTRHQWIRKIIRFLNNFHR